MPQLAFLLYIVFSFVYWLLAIFIVYHIRKYLLDPALANVLSIIFFVVMAIFFAVNVSLFLSIPWDANVSSSVWVTK